MSTQRPFEAIIFDHDGTLIDTETQDFRAFEMLFSEQGVTLSVEHWADIVVGHWGGHNTLFDELIAQTTGQTRELLKARLHTLWLGNLKHVTLMPYAKRVIHDLHEAGHRLAIATASDQAWVDRWLGKFELQSYFDVIATSDHVAENKPAPDVYLYAASQLGVSPDRCLVFEDSRAGLTSAKAAGMTVVAVPSPITESLDLSAADFVINGLACVNAAWIAGLTADL